MIHELTNLSLRVFFSMPSIIYQSESGIKCYIYFTGDAPTRRRSTSCNTERNLTSLPPLNETPSFSFTVLSQRKAGGTIQQF